MPKKEPTAGGNLRESKPGSLVKHGGKNPNDQENDVET
jgi:hypothetical protein